MVYKSRNPLFRDLTDEEEKEFRESAEDFCLHGFSLYSEILKAIHPVVRKEIIRVLEESLKEQGEL